MKKYLALLFVCLALCFPRPSFCGQEADEAKYKINPTQDKTSPTKVYIPKDLPDCFVELRKMLSPELIREMKKGGEKDMIDYHFGLGQWMRNNWGLWGGSRLSKYFNSMGIHHPDDMSGIILDSFWRHLKGKPIDLDEKVKHSRAYWAEREKEQEREDARVQKLKKEIPTKMLKLAYKNEASQIVILPKRVKEEGIRIRCAWKFKNGVLLTGKNRLGPQDGNFNTPCFYLDLKTKKIRPVHVPEMEQIEDGVVLGEKAYFMGILAGRGVLVALGDNVRKNIDMPPGEGWLRLGTSGNHLLAVRPKSIYEFVDSKWRLLCERKEDFPKCGMPAMRQGNRVYFRDEGQGGSDMRLTWVDINNPEKLEYFDRDVGMVGSEGPRWEMVWNYAFDPDGRLWIAAGTALLNWKKSEGYKIALINGSTQFDGEILVSIYNTEKLSKRTPINGIEPLADGTLNLIGPNGFYRLVKKELKRVLAFKNTQQEIAVNNGKSIYHWNWDPTQLITLSNEMILAGGMYDGVYLIQKDGKQYRAINLDENLGAPITFK